MKRTEAIMGMPITIEIIGEDPKTDELITSGFNEFRATDELFSTYKPTSEISRLNRGELTRTTVSPTVREVLKTCDELKIKTQGYFDMSYHGSLDPSGYVKGWSIGRVEAILRQGGATNFVVSAGGDMVCAGHRADGMPWVIGIADPSNPKQSVKNLNLSDQAIATSATYERGEHIYDPRTGLPAIGLVSVSVVGPDIVTADVYATTVFAMGQAGVSWIQGQADYAAYIIGTDGQAVLTPSLQTYIAA